jgi:hypothetical protein
MLILRNTACEMSGVLVLRQAQHERFFFFPLTLNPSLSFVLSVP